jgi:rhodanese-related sulfurtransferase
MKNTLKSYIFCALAIVLVLPGCWSSSEKKTGLVVINVLDKQMYDDCHIKGSICIPFEQLAERIVDEIDKDAEIVLYCSNYMCASSGYGCKQLAGLGFTNVSAYEGGTAEWYQEGLPVEGPANQKYLQRKLTAPEHIENDGFCIITVDQLADKLGVKKTSEK